VRRLATQLRRRATGELYCCYEAGPCGFTPQRQLAAAGVDCTVIAPSLIPRKPGERIKTDRRDARKLALLLRAQLLTAVRPPTPAEEAARDLCRTREDVSADLKRARQRLGSFLLRRGVTWRQRGRVWGFRHRLWSSSFGSDRTASRAHARTRRERRSNGSRARPS
jgi:transposase